MDVNKAIEKQLANIETRTGKTLAQLEAIVKKSGLTKHGEIRDMLKRDLGMGHGDANTLVHYVNKSSAATESLGSAEGKSTDAATNEIYSGAKAGLRPIHDKLIDAISKFGEFEIAPKKAYVSLRRRKQFAMVGPAASSRIEVGINMKGLTGSDRLIELAQPAMCAFKVKVSDVREVDRELLSWIKQAYDNAG